MSATFGLLSSYQSFMDHLRLSLAIAFAFLSLFAFPASAQQAEAPAVVQPGAPGQPSRNLPPDTKAALPPSSPKDAEFMQGMIMHHAQAVEMVGLMEGRTENDSLRLLGARISQSQAAEIDFMKSWLELRGKPIEMPMHDMKGMDHSHGGHSMPGMLSPKQMAALKKARGEEFDRLFLRGMIQHHKGALIMVKELFDTPGAGQDAAVFGFASDVDSGQRAEIRVMQQMLDKILEERK